MNGFDPQKCAQRNRVTALRYGIETTPIRFLGGFNTSPGVTPGADLATQTAPTGSTLIDAVGTLPADIDEALARINANLPSGAQALTSEDVYVHYCEAASNRFIADRYMFMGSQTLQNIALGGAHGCAFMNSHRTGGFSTESELPFGKTCSGRYEQYLDDDGNVFERALLGFYMLRNMAPNGANGPTTDTLSRMIHGGVLADVSVGLWPGETGTATCNVCDRDYRSCSHYAGSSYNMTEDDQEAAKARGVKTGLCSYTIDGWIIGEVSGVYDGAVPGAGFSKAHNALELGLLPGSEETALRSLYAALLAA